MTAAANAYSAGFFNVMADGSARSAEVVVPLVLGRFPDVRSVVDVGCGVGTWLAAFRSHGVEHIAGVDGYPSTEALRIPAECFQRVNLEQPIPLKQRFDLAITLEVAEHLTPDRGPSFVADLCSLADRVLFSAAVPQQGGTSHLNEQWPSYWISLFAKHGYGCEDSLRPTIWNDPRVEVWYRQNALYFVKGAKAQHSANVDIVHPELYKIHMTRLQRPTWFRALRAITPAPIRAAYKARLSR